VSRPANGERQSGAAMEARRAKALRVFSQTYHGDAEKSRPAVANVG